MPQFWSDAESQKHMRAICEEVGERLQFMLDRTAQEPPARLIALLRRFEETTASIAPDLEELVRPLRETARIRTR